jgi:hypothetical protein
MGVRIMQPLDSWLSIPGYLHPEEGAELQRIATGKRVLEIGCYRGRSTACMALVADHVTTVDTFLGDDDAGRLDGPGAAWKHLRNLDLTHWVTLISGDFRQTVPMLRHDFDILFYDADHSYEATYSALCMFADYPETTLAIHDYKLKVPRRKPIVLAVDNFSAEYSRRISIVRGLAVLTKAH